MSYECQDPVDPKQTHRPEWADDDATRGARRKAIKEASDKAAKDFDAKQKTQKQETDTSKTQQQTPRQAKLASIPHRHVMMSAVSITHPAAYLTSEVPPSDDSQMSLWYPDSGASSSFCNDRALFTTLDQVQPVPIEIVNGETIHADLKGTIDAHIISEGFEGLSVTLTDVFYVPKLSMNLISVGKND
jgi:hypothetical protein